MTRNASQADRRIELYVRSLSPSGSRRPQTAVLERVATLEAEDRVAESAVRVWGKQAPISPAEASTAAAVHTLEKVDAFRDWARHNGVSLDPAFELREVDAELSGESYRSLVFPTFLLAEYVDGSLACVTPHRDGDEVRTVADRLSRLERDATSTHEVLDRAAPSTPPRTRVEPDAESPVPE